MAGPWTACWTRGTFFASPHDYPPPQCSHCSVCGGLALLQPPLLTPTHEAQLRVRARARLPRAVWRPLVLSPPSLWRLVRTCTLHWLSFSHTHVRRHHEVALVSSPFFTP